MELVVGYWGNWLELIYARLIPIKHKRATAVEMNSHSQLVKIEILFKEI
jgi:hypothetical protein